MSASEKIRRRATVTAVFALLAAVYFIFDPAQYGWMPRCPFLSVTGYQCAGCGSQRLVHALLHLDVRAAWEANALLLLSLPYLIFWIIVDSSPRRRADHPRFSPRLARISAAMNSRTAMIIICVILVGWTMFRNIFL